MNFLVISHGPMASATCQSAEMIIGQLNNVWSASVKMDSTIESTFKEIEKIILSKSDEEWIILTDIVGGTPFNASYRFMENHSKIAIVSGFNLPLLLEVFMMSEQTKSELLNFIEGMKFNTISVVEKVEKPALDETIFDL